MKSVPHSASHVELSIVVPTFNEKDNIAPLLERLHNCLSQYNYEIIIVDDNSPDGTSKVAKALSTKYPLHVIVRTEERGLASAVVAGFKKANGNVLGVIDADLQHPPEELPRLMEAINEGADVAIGSRYISGGGTEGWSTKREIISKGAKLPASVLLPSTKGIKDPLSGFFLFKRNVIHDAVLAPSGYKILLEVLVKGKAENIVELPYVFKKRELGESNLTLKEEFNYLKHLALLTRAEGDITRFFKFCTVGASGTLVNLGLLTIFVEIFGLNPTIALIISYEISILTNFTLNETWTFRDRRNTAHGSIPIRAWKFNMVSGFGFAMNVTIFALFYHLLGIFYLISEIIAIGFTMLWNFFVNLKWTWRQKKSKPLPLGKQKHG